MMLDAVGYMKSARFLSQSMSSSHDQSSTFLSVLAFEIALKAVCYEENGTFQYNHDNKTIWNDVPKLVRETILQEAELEMPGHLDFSNLDVLLTDLSANFLKYRYSFETQRDRTEADVSRISDEWIENGAKLDDADFRFHPNETHALFQAMVRWFERKTGSSLCGPPPN